MAQPKAFYSYMENEEKLNMLSDEQAGRLYKALYAYSRTGEKPDLSDDPLLAYAFADFVIDIDRDRERFSNTCERRAEAGRKSGEARRTNADSAEQKGTKRTNVNFVEQKGTNTNKTNETESEAEAECTNVHKEKSIKEKFGEFQNVLLTAEEVHKLSERFPKTWRQMVERLSQYIAQTGKRYKSHYATILSWGAKEKPPDSKRGTVYSANGASFSIDDFERKRMFDD